MTNFLRTKGAQIVNGKNDPVFLRGANLGGWLMMEGYLLQAPNFPVHKFKNNFQEVHGEQALKEFEEVFRGTFICEEDFARVAGMGMNCIRLPFHYGLIETSPYRYDEAGAAYLDQAIAWAKKNGIYLILDLHAAPGCQNHDWHSDSAGECQLFHNKDYQQRSFALWEFLAARYRDEPAIAGYDLLNESVIHNPELLNNFYAQVIKAIRKKDQNHILFVEGNQWAIDLDCLNIFQDDNYALSFHHYQPLDFAFNFVPNQKYPLKDWTQQTTEEHLAKYRKAGEKHNVPIFLGEFGIHYRDGEFNEILWLEDVLKACQKFDFHWTYWTYKAVKNTMFPDGIFSYYDNPLWVSRQGPLSGWETYAKLWNSHKKEIVDSWRTDHFKENKQISEMLKKYAK